MNVRLALLIAVMTLAEAASAQPANVKEPDKLDAAADNVARMKSALKQVVGQAEQARADKDVVKLNCVNEKLTQIKALLSVAERADIALHESVAAQDRSADAEFSKIAIARTKVDGLRGDAERCVGQLAYNVDERTTVEVEQPGDLPGGGNGLGVAGRNASPTAAVTDIGFGVGTQHSDSWDRTFTAPVIVRPPEASPYR